MDKIGPFTGHNIENRFIVGPRLDQGAMGAVYKGIRYGERTQIALKFLLNTFDQNGIELFRREAEVHEQLQIPEPHPNILPIYKYGVTSINQSPIPYIAMELAHEGSLLSLLQKNQGLLSVHMAFDLVDQSLSGLEYAHRKGILHRDIQAWKYHAEKKSKA